MLRGPRYVYSKAFRGNALPWLPWICRISWRANSVRRSSGNPDCICGLFACIPEHCPALKGSEFDACAKYDDISLAPYQGSDLETIDMGLDLAGFRAGASILDIGCGDGRILIRGIQRGARSATGYELDSNVYKLACAHVSAALGKHDQSRVQIIEGDARNAELSSVDLITMYLIPKGLRLMEEHLDEQIQLNQMSQQTKVLTFGWRMPNWIPEAERSTVGGCKMYLYSVPSLAS